MMIQRGKIGAITFTLWDESGEEIDSNEGYDPLEYLHGAGNVLPALEKEIEKLQAGDSFEKHLMPDEAYGIRNEELIYILPPNSTISESNIGDPYQLSTGEEGIITRVSADSITIDANHPLSGMRLHYRVTLHSVRDAIPEEMEQGYPLLQGIRYCNGEPGCC